MKSELQTSPKSKIIEHGYINLYSELNAQEMRQVKFKRLYKVGKPAWDETLVFLAKRFAEVTPQDCTVLDAGCGNGSYIIDENRSRIAWASGIDFSENFVSKNICLDEIKIGNLEALPFDSNAYDAVTSLWVLEHLENPDKVFAEVNRVLKVGGVFMFATPNKNFLPLLVLKLMKVTKNLNHNINAKLFGRKGEDIFETYYRANSLEDIKKLCGDKFDVVDLKLNYDPSYTSFNSATFKLSNLFYKMMKALGLNLLDAHIVGILRKK